MACTGRHYSLVAVKGGEVSQVSYKCMHALMPGTDQVFCECTHCMHVLPSGTERDGDAGPRLTAASRRARSTGPQTSTARRTRTCRNAADLLRAHREETSNRTSSQVDALARDQSYY
eukprot:1423357-Rhodomonas_salina.4